MAFMVEDLRDLLELLRQHPDWRQQLWALLASEELLRLPAEFQAFQEEFRSFRDQTFESFRQETERRFQRVEEQIAALVEAQRRHYEEFAAHRQEFLTYRAEADRRFAELREELAAARAEADRRFAELAEAQARTEERISRLEEAIARLTEAQRRTEEQVQQLIEAQARTEERVSRLEEAIARLTEAQRRTEEQVQQLIEAQRRTEEQVQQLAEAQRRLEERVEQLTEALRQTQEQIEKLARSQDQMRATLDRFAQIIGPAVEERLIPALREWVKEQGGALVGPVVSMTLDGIGEVDGVARIRWPEGRETWVLVSVKARVWPRDIREFRRGILEDAEARQALRARGISDPVWPIVFGLTLDDRALEAAIHAKVGLLISQQGMIVPPTPWSLEEGQPLSPD
ncbi:Chromosome partition protein Smc [Candidatus Thermoflexus japonica]|uniref:Chromosome partition protein Smc n=1 Tax=Candidatus Thermoflexus japonica TaxID=2035417 RepID=A0A2H5Y8Y9_9CHLR|nr:Chromosome partition protein Smc [Candidatus Thermoflexus japonica]